MATSEEFTAAIAETLGLLHEAYELEASWNEVFERAEEAMVRSFEIAVAVQMNKDEGTAALVQALEDAGVPLDHPIAKVTHEALLDMRWQAQAANARLN